MKTKALYLKLVLVFTVVFLGELALVLKMNGGIFSYTLDDPYIHMALAKHIAQGHYGINAGEYSAPSSSIIWPFLLAPFARFGWFEYWPLIINYACSLGIIYLFTQLLTLCLAEFASKYKQVLMGLAIAGLVVATNLIGLSFAGMEHILQMYLALLIVYGIILSLRDGTVPWWLVAAIIAGPLVRYENLALSVLAVIYLAVRRQWQAALSSVLMLGAIMGGFSVYLHSLGLGYFPSSVLAKSAWVATGHLKMIMLAFRRHFTLTPMSIMLFSAFGLALYRFVVDKTTDRYLALMVGAAIMGHVLFGYPRWYFRYDAYIFSVVMMGLIYLFRGELTKLCEKLAALSPVTYGLVLLAACCLTGWAYAANATKTAISANNIFEQQYQMHRFVRDYYQEPVAINDLGWVAYENPHYVLDLWGLASLEALVARMTAPNPAWMDQLARKHDVKLAIIYDSWFKIKPPAWKPVARMELGKRRITPGDWYVTFYALDDASYQKARQKLLEFKGSLPAGVKLKVY